MRELAAELDFKEVYDHFNTRLEVHEKINDDLKTLMAIEGKDNFEFKRKQFVNYILGVTTCDANYSADSSKRFGGGGKAILADNMNAYGQVYALEKSLLTLEQKDLPSKIKGSKIFMLGLGTGSEMACLLRPDTFWVTNKRTYWVKLLAERGLSYANEVTELHTENALKVWYTEHHLVGSSLVKLTECIAKENLPENENLSQHYYLFADCLATSLYDNNYY